MKFEKEIRELEEKLEKLKRAAGGKPDTTTVEVVSIPSKFEIHAADREMDWQEAMDYAKSIEMRLPTKLELQVIAASTDEFNDLGWTWSSSTRSDSTGYAWFVYLVNGFTTNDCKTDPGSVLCVSP